MSESKLIIHMLARVSSNVKPAACRLSLSRPARFGPARLRRFSEGLAALFGADIAPARRAKTNSCSPDRLRREFPARDIEELNRKIEQDLRWQTGLTHHAAEPRRATRAEHAGQLCCQCAGNRRPEQYLSHA